MSKRLRRSDGPRVLLETKRRSIAKALSWRFVATAITAGVVFIITGEPTAAIEIGILDTTVKLGVYFMHERIWLRIPFGLPPPPDYRI